MKNTRSSVTEQKTHFILKNSQVFLAKCLSAKKLIEDSEAEITVTDKGNARILNLGSREKLLVNEPKRIVKELSLPSNWEEPIREYLITGKLLLPITSSIQPLLTFNHASKKWELYIQIFKKTTAKDIESAWRAIKKLQSLLDDFAPIEISEKDLGMVRLYDEGKSMKEIGETLLSNLPYNETDISKRIRLVKKKLSLSRDKK